MTHFQTKLLPALLRRLSAQGIDAAAFAARHGVKLEPDQGPDMEVTAEVLQAACDDAQRLLHDDDLGLHSVEAIQRGTYGLLEFIGRSCETLGQVVRVLPRYARLINRNARLELVPRGDDLAIEHSYVAVEGDPGRHSNEFFIAALVFVGRSLAKEVTPRSVWFLHPRPPSVRELERYFGTTDLTFGAATNGLLLSAADVARKIPTYDPELHRLLTVQIDKELAQRPETDDLVGSVKKSIRDGLMNGTPRIGPVARRLGMTTRTLQRRLAERGQVFQKLADETRYALAREHLAHAQMPLAEVAFLLGYTSFGAFIRAFRAWSGQTPGEYRTAVLAAGRA